MTIEIKGYNGVVQQPLKVRRNGVGHGWHTVASWKGPKASINSLRYDPRLAQAEEIDCVISGNRAELTAIFPFDAAGGAGASKDNGINVVWECHPQRLEKDLRTHPAFKDILAELARVDEKIDSGKSSEVTTAGGYSALAVSYKDLRLKGVTSYPEEYFVVTKTTRCGSAMAVKAAQVAERTVVTVSSLSLPDGVKFNIPSSYEALKGKPDVVQVPGGWQIVEHWTVCEAFSKTLYTGATGTP